MNQPAPVDGAIREKLSTYLDPYLGQTLGEAKAIVAVASANGDLLTVNRARIGVPLRGLSA